MITFILFWNTTLFLKCASIPAFQGPNLPGNPMPAGNRNTCLGIRSRASREDGRGQQGCGAWWGSLSPEGSSEPGQLCSLSCSPIVIWPQVEIWVPSSCCSCPVPRPADVQTEAPGRSERTGQGGQAGAASWERGVWGGHGPMRFKEHERHKGLQTRIKME